MMLIRHYFFLSVDFSKRETSLFHYWHLLHNLLEKIRTFFWGQMVSILKSNWDRYIYKERHTFMYNFVWNWWIWIVRAFSYQRELFLDVWERRIDTPNVCGIILLAAHVVQRLFEYSTYECDSIHPYGKNL